LTRVGGSRCPIAGSKIARRRGNAPKRAETRDETRIEINERVCKSRSRDGSFLSFPSHPSRAFTEPINHDWLIRFNCAQRGSPRVMNVHTFNVNGINIRHAKWIRSYGGWKRAGEGKARDIRQSAIVFDGFKVRSASVRMRSRLCVRLRLTPSPPHPHPLCVQIASRNTLLVIFVHVVPACLAIAL